MYKELRGRKVAKPYPPLPINKKKKGGQNKISAFRTIKAKGGKLYRKKNRALSRRKGKKPLQPCSMNGGKRVRVKVYRRREGRYEREGKSPSICFRDNSKEKKNGGKGVSTTAMPPKKAGNTASGSRQQIVEKGVSGKKKKKQKGAQNFYKGGRKGEKKKEA